MSERERERGEEWEKRRMRNERVRDIIQFIHL